jgi:hypothetical protein
MMARLMISAVPPFSLNASVPVNCADDMSAASRGMPALRSCRDTGVRVPSTAATV